MRTNSFTRALRIGVALALLGGFAIPAAQARENEDARARNRIQLSALLFSLLEVNNVFCGVNALGELCVDPTNSSTVPGGFWPKGSPNGYIFNSGLQLAGIIPSDAGFEWASDTTGVFFMDPRGDQGAGDPVSLVYNSLDPDDAANWPDQAIVRDTAIFSSILIGRQSVSQQDLWNRTWDGNPTLAGAREHPLGVLVEERAMGWNFPSGNEDIVYFVFTFYNISAEDPAAYAGLDPAIRDSIHDIAVDYVQGAEDRFGVDIPFGGYEITEFYNAFFMDPDVGDARANYGSAILPFQMAIAYKSNFLETNWQYPPAINGPPFAAAPGFIGVKYLLSPTDPVSGNEVGLSLFSTTYNAVPGAMPDPTGVVQMWRYLSGNNDPAQGDFPCNVANPIERKLCFLFQNDDDVRFFQSSGGPTITLPPGGSGTIVVAYIHAAPVAAPLTAAGGVGGDVKPFTPYTGDSIAANQCDANPDNGSLGLGPCVRQVDEIAGWLGHADTDGSAEIEQDEVLSVPGSLLDKAMVAQAVFDNKFLLPFAPDPPTFYLVAGDNEVTVVWEQSTSETLGDPFHAIASDPLSPLYDPNFRLLDVEGYRIYRGRTAAQLELIAQFDYAGTSFVDATGAFDYGNLCAPELDVTSGCPADFYNAGGTGAGETESHDIGTPFVQVLGGCTGPGGAADCFSGGRVPLTDGTIFITASDSVASSNGFPAFANTGVPFAYVDRAVRNAFTYHYAVTAFDVNSLKSGPSSLESARVTQTIVPRSTASNVVAPEGITWALLDRDDNELDPAAPHPTIDATTGTFSGPAPPTAALSPFAAELFAPGLVIEGQTATFQIDSVFPYYYHDGNYYMTLTGPTGTSQVFLPSLGTPGNGDGLPLGQEQVGQVEFAPLKLGLTADQTVAAEIGLEGIPLAGEAQALLSVYEVTYNSTSADWHPQVEGAFFDPQDPALNDAIGNVDQGGSRWFDGDNETTADPTLLGGHGALSGVTAIYQPAPFAPWENADAHTRRPMQTMYHTQRAADIKLYWGASGGLDSVIDVTHNVPMTFQEQNRVGWGFIGDNSCAGCKTSVPTPDGLITYEDWPQGACFVGMGNWNQTGCATRVWFNSITAAGGLLPTDTDGDHTNGTEGTGFGMWINGAPYYFNTTAIPAAGTVWTLRDYNGLVSQDASGAYSYAPQSSNVPIPGLRLVATVGAPAVVDDTLEVDLTLVHTVPDPYYVTTSLEATSNNKLLQFVNLPNQAIVRIYSVSGILVQILEHNDPAGGGTLDWDLRNRNNQIVASGVYFYHVETATGQETTGRFTVVNFAQ
jgi:hypothetical protein